MRTCKSQSQRNPIQSFLLSSSSPLDPHASPLDYVGTNHTAVETHDKASASDIFFSSPPTSLSPLYVFLVPSTLQRKEETKKKVPLNLLSWLGLPAN
ncbi:unnamed protein product [Periconia digitata]|uniref:Uncharacterized protein n=1 Tax=Periconia digitata TaxID=1303443 RepID=A0A9W4UDP4_9PLEO|nr:unnamed protein product [Periconia digitata]